MTLDEIKEFWVEQARRHGASPAASWSDVRVLDLEVREIAKWLDDGDRVLDMLRMADRPACQSEAGRHSRHRLRRELVDQAHARVTALTTPPADRPSLPS
jgi:hypothetical protein